MGNLESITFNTTDHLSLSALNQLIQDILDGNFEQNVWVVAEIAELRVNARSGHCYLELIEKQGTQIVAKTRASIWKFNYQSIAQKFFKTCGTTLQSGLKVLCAVSVSYHAVYGLSLVVHDIDASFALGELESAKKALLLRLQKEGLVAKNKQVPLPFLPKRIAIISSETAAGYEDFTQQLFHNNYGFCFEYTLFSSSMQGEQLGHSMIAALHNIAVRKDEFDVVVIIRGGGATMDLNGFNQYDLCKTIAHFPLPILSGIGHERDHTLVDEVAHTKLKTPTAVAEFLIDRFVELEEYTQSLQQALKETVRERIANQKKIIQKLSMILLDEVQNFNKTQHKYLQNYKESIPVLMHKKIQHHQKNLTQFNRLLNWHCSIIFKNTQKQLLELPLFLKKNSAQIFVKKSQALTQQAQLIKLLSPENTLKRGYVLLKDEQQQFIKSLSEFKTAQNIEVIFKDGKTQLKK